MKILINALSAKLGGGQTYLVNFLQNIPADFPHEIIFLCGTFNEEKFRKAAPSNIQFEIKGQRLKNSLYRTLWELFFLPRELKKQQFDVYFQPAVGVPIPVPRNCRSVTMLRNMLPFEDRERKRFPFFSISRLKLYLLKLFILKSLAHYDRVIFISRYSQQFIERFIPEIQSKSYVVPHGLGERFLNKAPQNAYDIQRFGLKAGNFYLYVSIFNYYKAQLEVVREWKNLVDSGFQYPLVMAGFMDQSKYAKKVKDEINRLQLNDRVFILGSVNYNDLPSFYQQARALIFASSCECCPNILLEKMSAGRPVFCSDIGPMPEFGGDAPYYFAPYQPGDLSQTILRAEADPSGMQVHAEKSQLRAKEYTWNKSIKAALAFITS